MRTQRNLVFRIAEIVDDKLKKKRNKQLFLKMSALYGLIIMEKHIKEIHRVLQDVLGYNVFCDILNSADYGIPQTRNRTYIVCFDNQNAKFIFPQKEKLKKTLQDLLEPEVDNKYFCQMRILPQYYLMELVDIKQNQK